MADIIATVWDFDKTLIPGYMQDPIFNSRKLDPKAFWEKNNARIKELQAQGLDVNPDTYYLNTFISEARIGGALDGINNETIRALGKELKFYKGAIDLFKAIHELNNDDVYNNYGIKFECYIVSTGLKKMIQGSEIAPYVKKIWGAEFVDSVDKEDGKTRITEIAYSLDNSTKTRAVFEINKGVGIEEGSTIDVNTKIPEEERRVQFCNMVYVADGPSDVPAFSLVVQKGGATMAVYPKGDAKAFRQVYELSKAGRVNMVAEADYTEGSQARLWLMGRLREQADKLVEVKRSVFKRPAGTPSHLI